VQLLKLERTQVIGSFSHAPAALTEDKTEQGSLTKPSSPHGTRGCCPHWPTSSGKRQSLARQAQIIKTSVTSCPWWALINTYCIFHVDTQVRGVPRLTTLPVDPLQVVIQVIQHLVGFIAVFTHFRVVIWW